MRRKYVVLLAAVVATYGMAVNAVAQESDAEGVNVVEGIDVLAGLHDEAVYYYTNNWLVFRKAALEKGYIDAYEFIVDESGSGEVDILLITRFASERQFQAIEQRYTELMSDRQLMLLNDVQPGEFRRSVFVVRGKSGESDSR